MQRWNVVSHKANRWRLETLLLRRLWDVSYTFFDAQKDDSYTGRGRVGELVRPILAKMNCVGLCCCLIFKFIDILKLYLSQRAYRFPVPVVIVFLTTNHIFAASGVPHPSTRTVSTQGTTEVYETSHYHSGQKYHIIYHIYFAQKYLIQIANRSSNWARQTRLQGSTYSRL